MFFYPRTIEIRQSEINGEIKVTELLGTFRLVVGGYTQSGGLLHNIWDKALKTVFKQKKYSNPNVLILGFAGGTAAKIVKRIWPQSQISGIEIDPVIIDLSRKYFRTDEIFGLSLVQDDAIDWVKKEAKKKAKKFDIILVDLYIGSHHPKELLDPNFLDGIKKLLSNEGVALFNKLIVKAQKTETIEFQNNLSAIFKNIKRVKTPANAVFLAQ